MIFVLELCRIISDSTFKFYFEDLCIEFDQMYANDLKLYEDWANLDYEFIEINGMIGAY